MSLVRRATLLSLAFAAALAGSLAAQQRNPEEYAKTLEGAERVARMQVARVVETLALRPGMAVADIGSGSGLFTRPIAQAVAPGGTVYAVDIDAGLLDIIRRRAAEERIPNIRTVLAPTDDPRLPEPVDLAFICDTLHHISGPAAYLRTLAKYVRAGGRVIVIDFSERWPAGHESMRYSEAQLAEWMADAGFTRTASYDYLDNSFFIVFQRK